MADRPHKDMPMNIDGLTARNLELSLKTAESPSERASRLRREEAEAVHNRQINLLVHRAVIVSVGMALAACVVVILIRDPKTGLPDKAMNIITAIVAAGVGYITGKGSK